VEPEHLRFGGGATDTLLHPLVAVEMAVAVILILCLSRKLVLAPLLLAIFTIPLGQVVLVASMHLTVPRILILAGLVRWAVSQRSWPGRLFAGGANSLDRLFALWAVLSFATFSLQWLDTQALIKSFGTLIDTLGGYVVLRFLIQDIGDVRQAVKLFGLIALVMGACMLNERLSGRNVFGLLGGLPPMAMRDGAVRSQGAFEVYITAGVFGATLMPLLVWLWSDANSRIGAAAGIVGATVMTFTSQSSTSVSAFAFGIAALCFWPLRRQMRVFRWILVVTLTGLHLVMKAPVWALIARIDLTGSSSGYHRYMLVDNFIRHFGDWWLLGARDYNAWGWDMWDLSNQYVACGITGGLVTLFVFVWIICKSFAQLGTTRQLSNGNWRQKWLLWCLGAALLAHLVAYFGIGYFDQMQFAWYALLAMISAAVSEVKGLSVPQRQAALAAS